MLNSEQVQFLRSSAGFSDTPQTPDTGGGSLSSRLQGAAKTYDAKYNPPTIPTEQPQDTGIKINLGPGMGVGVGTGVGALDLTKPIISAGKAMAGSEIGLGQDLGQSLAYLSGTGKETEKINQQNIQTGDGFMRLAIIHKDDPVKAQNYFNQAKSAFEAAGQNFDNVLPFYKKTTEQVLGEAGGTLVDVLAAGTFGKAGAEVLKPASGFIKGAIEGAKTGAKVGALYGGAKGITGGMEAGGNAGEVALSGAGGAITGGIGGAILGGTIGGISGRVSNQAERLAQKETDNTWKMIQPELTKTEQAEAVKSGRITQEGKLGTVKQIPNARDTEMINASQPYVSGAKNELEAVANMKQGIADSANKVRTGLEQSNAIWNKNELTGEINKIQEPITVKSDTTLHNTFDNFKRAVLDLADKANKKTIGILDLRQNLDDLIDNEFGSKIYDKNNPMSNVIRSFRNTLNDFAESKIPDGKLPDGSTFRGELRKQTLLYNAIDNTAPKVGKLGSNAITRWIKENPKKANFVKWALMLTGAEKVLKTTGMPLP